MLNLERLPRIALGSAHSGYEHSRQSTLLCVDILVGQRAQFST